MNFNSFYKTVSEGILAIDKKGTILYSNSVADTMFGFSDRESAGKKIMACIGGEDGNDEFRDAVTDVIFSDTDKITRKVHYANQDRQYVLLLSSVYVNTEDFRGIILVFTDISELEKLEKTEETFRDIVSKNDALKKQNDILAEAFRHHLDDDVVEELLNSPEGFGIHATSKNLSLFLLMSPDIQNLVRKMSARDYLRLLNHYYDMVIPLIKKNRGTIIALHSDEILVGFGVSPNAKRYTDAAFRAAARIQQAMPELNAWNEQESYPRIGVKIGIHTSELTIGVIGGTSVSKYDVFGKNVNFAARMTMTADNTDIVLSEPTLKYLTVKYEILKQYEVIPKGISEPVKVYKVKLK